MSASSPSSLAGQFASFTKFSKIVAGVLITGYLAAVVYKPTPQYFALVAGRTFPRIWNVFTASLLEVHIFSLVFNAAAVLVLSRAIEPVFGSRQYLKFIAIVDIAAGLGAFVTVYIVYAFNRSAQEANLLYTEICGFHGVLAGLLVALKQVSPDTEITFLQSLHFRAKHLAAVYVLATIAWGLLAGSTVKTVPMVLSGAYVAWFYLRFHQPSPNDESQRGDPSPQFRFASFFPAGLQPAVDSVAGAAARIFRVGIQPQEGRSSGSVASVAVPAAASAEASRRRERGARALEERLGLKSTVTVSNEQAQQVDHGDIETGTATGGNGETPPTLEANPVQAVSS